MKNVNTLELFLILTMLCALILQSHSCDWTGLWDTNYGQLVLFQSGNYVNGTYTFANGGEINGTTSGNTLVGNWTQTDSSGTLEFMMVGDCNSFSGNWRYGDSGKWLGNWDGNRISVEKLKNDLQDLRDEINETDQGIQEQIEESNRRISAAFRAGKITLLGLSIISF